MFNLNTCAMDVLVTLLFLSAIRFNTIHIFIDSVTVENTDTKVWLEIRIKDNLEVIKTEAEQFGLWYKRKIVSNIHLFEGSSPTDGVTINEMVERLIAIFPDEISDVEVQTHGIIRHTLIEPTSDNPGQDYKTFLVNRRKRSKVYCAHYDESVVAAWYLDSGYTGKGVVVAVVDNGVDMNHPDLQLNSDKERSRSFVDKNQSNVYPQWFYNYPEYNELAGHGTLASGLIAAEFGNDNCFAGVAYNSSLIALKVFRIKKWQIRIGRKYISYTDEHIPSALQYGRSFIDVYSCSFNIYKAYAKNSMAVRETLREGVRQGRNGKGSIFVFSAGNQIGEIYDCNMEAYASSIFTITIASAGRHGKKPSYALPCSCILASTFGDHKTWYGETLESTSPGGKYQHFGGTSAAAARASGVTALVLEAKLVHGVCGTKVDLIDPKGIQRIEHVTATIEYKTDGEIDKSLNIVLCSPLESCSNLRNNKENAVLSDRKKKGKIQIIRRNWTFMSVKFWGEQPNGTWLLLIAQDKSHGLYTRHWKFELLSFRLTVYGTSGGVVDMKRTNSNKPNRVLSYEQRLITFFNNNTQILDLVEYLYNLEEEATTLDFDQTYLIAAIVLVFIIPSIVVLSYVWSKLKIECNGRDTHAQ